MTFEYLEPRRLDDAIEALRSADVDTMALAGGTAFTLLVRQGLVRPRRVVGLRRLADLAGIRPEGDGVWIGALATHRQIETSPIVRARHPELASAFATIATIRIRNQATIGGNLAHADPSQDPPPILIALEALIHLAGPDDSRRTVPVDGFFTDFLTTVLQPGELILGVSVPGADPAARTAYRKFLPRTADDYATVSVAASARLDDAGRVATIRVALAGVGSTPVRAHSTEGALAGVRPDSATIRDAAELIRSHIEPLDDVRGRARYKREMAVVWVRRALTDVLA